jgi:hypothetical protein
MQHPERLLHHYTGAGALLSIVTKRALWATSTDFLNDRQEGERPNRVILDMVSNPEVFLPGLENLQAKYLEAVKHSLGSGYLTATVSFSKHPRSLPQFRMYGPSAGGFVVGFPKDYLQKVGTLIQCDYSHENLWAWCKEYVANYLALAAKADEPHLTAQALSHKISSGQLIHERVEASLIFKSEDFVNEAESRLYWRASTERVNDFAPPFLMNLLRKTLMISS